MQWQKKRECYTRLSSTDGRAGTGGWIRGSMTRISQYRYLLWEVSCNRAFARSREGRTSSNSAEALRCVVAVFFPRHRTSSFPGSLLRAPDMAVSPTWTTYFGCDDNAVSRGLYWSAHLAPAPLTYSRRSVYPHTFPPSPCEPCAPHIDRCYSRRSSRTFGVLVLHYASHN